MRPSRANARTGRVVQPDSSAGGVVRLSNPPFMIALFTIGALSAIAAGEWMRLMWIIVAIIWWLGAQEERRRADDLSEEIRSWQVLAASLLKYSRR